MRVLREDQLFLVVQVVKDVSGGGGDLEQQQPDDAGAVGGHLFDGVAEHGQAHGGLLVEQRRVGGDLLPGDLGDDLFGDGAVDAHPGVPVGQPAAFPDGGGHRAALSARGSGPGLPGAFGVVANCRLRAAGAGRPGGQGGPGLDAERTGQGRAVGRGQRLLQHGQLLGLVQDLGLGVHDGEGEAQVRRQRIPVPGPRRDHHALKPAQYQLQGGGKVVGLRVEVGLQRGHCRAGDVGGRDEVLADGLGQRLDQRGDQLHAQPGDEPAEAHGVKLVQEEHRHAHRDAVGFPGAGRRVVLVDQIQVQGAMAPGAREGVLVQFGGIGLEHVLRVEVQQRRVFVPRGLPPAVEVPFGHHLGAQLRIVELEEVLVADAQIAPAHAGLEFLDVLEHPAVAGEELVVGLPVALHQCVADEQFAAELRVHARVLDAAARHDRQSKERDLLIAHDRARIPRPVRFGVAALEQVPGDLLDPLGIEPGHGACPKPGSLHQLGGHDPLGGLPRQGRTGEDGEAGAAGADIFALALVPGAHVPQQPGEQRNVDGVLVRGRVHRLGGDRDAQGLGQLAQLGEQVLPLAHAQVVDVFVLAQPAEGGGREFLLLFLQVAPEVQQRGEVRLRVHEALVHFGGALALAGFLAGALARVLDGQGSGKHHDLLGAAPGAGLHDHPAQPHVDRQLGQ